MGKQTFFNRTVYRDESGFAGGHYDLLVEDTQGKDYQADIYIRTHLAGISRMYFWRIRFNDDLLDISNSIIVELYAAPDVQDFPTVGGPRPIAGEVEALLVKRAENQKKSDQLAMELLQASNIKKVIEKLNGRVPEDFQQNWPVSTIDEIMNNKDPVEPPNLTPPLPEERPSAPGPDSSIPSSSLSPSGDGLRLVGSADYDRDQSNSIRMADNDSRSMTGNRIDDLSNDLITASEKLVTNTNLAWDENDEHGVGMSPIAQEYHQEAAMAKQDAYSAFNSLIDESKIGLREAPSAGAREAMEEMVAQTVIAGMGGIAQAIERSYDHLVADEGRFIAALPNSAAAQNLLKAWRAAEERTQNDSNQLTQLASEISGYSKASEVSMAMTNALDVVQTGLETIRASVAAAEARLAELLEEEAAAAAAAAAAAGGTIQQ